MLAEVTEKPHATRAGDLILRPKVDECAAYQFTSLQGKVVATDQRLHSAVALVNQRREYGSAQLCRQLLAWPAHGPIDAGGGFLHQLDATVQIGRAVRPDVGVVAVWGQAEQRSNGAARDALPGLDAGFRKSSGAQELGPVAASENKAEAGRIGLGVFGPETIRG